MKNKGQKGFTLIELLVVIAIIGILASIGLSALTSARKKARDSRRKSDLREVANALELFYADNGKYPNAAGWVAMLDQLKTGGYVDKDIKDPLGLVTRYYCYGVSSGGGEDQLYYRVGATLEVATDSSMWTDGNPADGSNTGPAAKIYEMGNALGGNVAKVSNCNQ